ncbi:hypothetical protein C1646_676306 [Rhizophagus diaphanus]|nr:hypothetical protein C1646_676306 [Rhizophagus diaphanus] [Rhizophagus sp. MUCL 43196]
MDEDYVANSQVADVGKDGPSSSPQQNISGENTSTLHLNNTAAPFAPSCITSSRSVDASIYAPKNKENLPPNASSDIETNNAPASDQTLDPTPTFTIKRQDF